LHCAFTGLDDDTTPGIHQMVCRLGNDFRVEAAWIPNYEDRSPIEKNWQFFEHEGELYSVYSIRPHLILRHQRRRARRAFQTEARLPWPEMHLRGGAPPVRFGNEYYHFFHTVQETSGHYHYALSVYTFAAKPPFAIRRFAQAPLLTPADYDRPIGYYKSVIFPCGALRRGDAWAISYGYHDQECRVAVIDADQIERRLGKVRLAATR
jgi:predicted GH43/DUF377 family glycosyl hydrolase